MPYLVDGNNLMGMLKVKTRRELLERLAFYASKKKIKIQVVFDGAAERFFPDGSSYKGVKVFYGFSDADAKIKRLVESEKNRRSLIVVTDDLSLSSYCRSCGAQTIRTARFVSFFENVKAQGEEKPTVEECELKEWMRYFGVSEDDE